MLYVYVYLLHYFYRGGDFAPEEQIQDLASRFRIQVLQSQYSFAPLCRRVHQWDFVGGLCRCFCHIGHGGLAVETNGLLLTVVH